MSLTFTLIAKQVLSSDSTSVIFSNIPGTYTSLLLLSNARSSRTNENFDVMTISFNGSTSSFSRKSMQADNASISTWSANDREIAILPTATNTNIYGFAQTFIPNYSSSASNKGFLTDSGMIATRFFQAAYSGRWANTSAINSISLFAATGNLTSGSSFYLYGLK